MSSFIDTTKIKVRSGHGGGGRVSFKRAKNLPKLGADGGDGGFGGNVILKGSNQINTLTQFRFKRYFKAEDGEKGGTSGKTGRDGEDCIIHVPLGTLIYEENGESKNLIAEILKDKETIIIAKGGKRGLGNRRYLSSIHQAPEESTPGGDSVELELNLELKLLADIGLAGFPNAGKSTLLSMLTSAKPKIADYPFTTLIPQLGVLEFKEEYKSIVLADIPGLIEGASEGRGLGLDFLRHLERTDTILHVIDPFNPETKSPSESLKLILKELKNYSHVFNVKKHIICINKSDLLDMTNKPELTKITRPLKRILKEAPVFFISAATGFGLQDLKNYLLQTHCSETIQ